MEKLLYSKIIGEGKPMIIMHGYLGMSDNWKTLGARFAEAGFQVHLLDLRNHGRSFHSSDFDYTYMSEDVANYCAHHNLKDVTLIGHSMGGKVAMFAACEYPDLVDKMIVADISPKSYPPHHQDIMQALNAVNFDEMSSRKEVENVIEQYIKEFGVRQFLMKSVHRVSADKLGFRFNLEVFNQSQETIGEALPDNAVFHKNTLFIKGEKSNYINTTDDALIKKHFPNSNIQTVSNAGHWLHADNPDDFYDKVMTFLAD